MTHDEINIEIAKLLGWTEIESVQLKHLSHAQIQGVAPGTIASQHTGYKPKHLIPHYCGDIKAAWLVVEHLTTSEGSPFELVRNHKNYQCSFDAWMNVHEAPTAPEAICLAAISLS